MFGNFSEVFMNFESFTVWEFLQISTVFVDFENFSGLEKIGERFVWPKVL